MIVYDRFAEEYIEESEKEIIAPPERYMPIPEKFEDKLIITQTDAIKEIISALEEVNVKEYDSKESLSSELENVTLSEIKDALWISQLFIKKVRDILVNREEIKL